MRRPFALVASLLALPVVAQDTPVDPPPAAEETPAADPAPSAPEPTAEGAEEDSGDSPSEPQKKKRRRRTRAPRESAAPAAAAAGAVDTGNSSAAGSKPGTLGAPTTTVTPNAPTPAPAAPAVGIPETSAAAGSDAERAFVREQAHGFFSRLILSDARGIVRRSGVPFQLEARRIETTDGLLEEWNRHLRTKRADLLTLFDIEVLTPAEMERRHGKPPARLAQLPWQAPRTYIAVANLSGHAAIAIYRQNGRAFQVVGYSD